MNNLANASMAQGKYSLAETLQIKTADIMRNMYGSDNPNTLEGVNVLAAIYSYQRKNQEAEQILSESLPIVLHVLGSEHGATLTNWTNLANVLLEQDKLPPGSSSLQRNAGDPASRSEPGAPRNAADACRPCNALPEVEQVRCGGDLCLAGLNRAAACFGSEPLTNEAIGRRYPKRARRLGAQSRIGGAGCQPPGAETV